MVSTSHHEAGVMPGLPLDAVREPAPPASAPLSNARDPLLRNADFLQFWGAHAVSQLDAQVTALALPLLAAITLEASPIEVGLLAAVGWLPFLVVGLPAGV